MTNFEIIEQNQILEDILTEDVLDFDALGEFMIGFDLSNESKYFNGGFYPQLGPCLLALYNKINSGKYPNLEQNINDALINLIQTKGNRAMYIIGALTFINTHLMYEKDHTANFRLQMDRILPVLKERLERSKEIFNMESVAYPNKKNGIWEDVEYYADQIKEHSGSRVL